MRDIALAVRSDGLALPATLTLPDGPPRGGAVMLHGAAHPSRGHFLYRHLAGVAPARGIAVLRYDRRPGDGADVPLEAQATDALAAMARLRREAELDDAAPVGLWGWSQGAWAAAVTAARSDAVAFLALVGCAGVSPGAQMRYATARQLTLAGYGADTLAELAALRDAFEAFQRGTLPRAAAQAAVDRARDRPWFALASVPPVLGEPGSWRDMDFDPAPVFARVRCPVLLLYGEADDWVPIEAGVAVWRNALASAGNDDLTVVRIPGTNHTPTSGEAQSLDAVSPVYTERLLGWLEAVTARG